MNKALAQRCQKSSVVSITNYWTWTNTVKQEGKLLRQDLENACSVSLNVLTANSRSHTIPASSAHLPSSALTVRELPPPTPRGAYLPWRLEHMYERKVWKAK